MSNKTKIDDSKQKKVTVEVENKSTAQDDLKQKELELKQTKDELEKAQEKIVNLEVSFLKLKQENEKNILDFQEKAKSFSAKAQEEISKFKAKEHEKNLRDKEESKKYSIQKLVEGIIEPILNIKLAVDTGKNNESVKGYVLGFEMLLNQLFDELSHSGVELISPTKGEEFNPEKHFALSKIKDDSNVNKVIEVKKLGISLHQRIIKPATVIIGE